MMRLFSTALIASILMSCSDSSGNVATNVHSDILNAPSAVTERKPISMSASKPCGNTMRERTTCMIELILADVRDNYNDADGGGIARITGHSSTSYTVSLTQEERVDLFTYEFAVTNTKVSMTSRTPGTL